MTEILHTYFKIMRFCDNILCMDLINIKFIINTMQAMGLRSERGERQGVVSSAARTKQLGVWGRCKPPSGVPGVAPRKFGIFTL